MPALVVRIHRQAVLPVRNIGSIHLAACGAEETAVLWVVNFDLDDEAAWGHLREGIEALYRSSLDGLEAHRAARPRFVAWRADSFPVIGNDVAVSSYS